MTQGHKEVNNPRFVTCVVDQATKKTKKKTGTCLNLLGECFTKPLEPQIEWTFKNAKVGEEHDSWSAAPK